MDSKLFYGFLDKLLQKHRTSKTPATRWSLPVNDNFTKSVLKTQT